MVAVLALVLAACGQGGEGGSGPQGITAGGQPCPAVPVDEQRAEGIETLHAFDGTDGVIPYDDAMLHLDEPRGRLVIGPDGSTVYGMTRQGGSADAGVIFSFDPGSRAYQVVHEFGPGPSNGEQPTEGSLVVAEGRLWGLTALGGVSNDGVVFSIAPDGSDFRVHHAFEDESDGALPLGSLTQEGSWLYGLTFEGGRWGLGTVFRVSTQGEGYELLASFGGSQTGAHPYGQLIVDADAGYLYGITGNGGEHDPSCELALGTVFRLPLPGG